MASQTHPSCGMQPFQHLCAALRQPMAIFLLHPADDLVFGEVDDVAQFHDVGRNEA